MPRIMRRQLQLEKDKVPKYNSKTGMEHASMITETLKVYPKLSIKKAIDKVLARKDPAMLKDAAFKTALYMNYTDANKDSIKVEKKRR